MKLQKLKNLSELYTREEKFSQDLADHISHLGLGNYEEVEIESRVGTRRADIVATGGDGVLVVENQFGLADWDHWGRLESYARLKDANIAVLVAERFEELMIVTCNLRNEDSKIDWYLIKVEVNERNEFSFHPISRPAIDIQTQKNNIDYSDFWEPIRKNGLFAGKPVPARDEGWISKGVKGIELCLQFQRRSCSVCLYFQGEGRWEKRDQVAALFNSSKYRFELGESPKYTKILFPVIEKGKEDVESWPEIRDSLTSLGEDIYHIIETSNF